MPASSRDRLLVALGLIGVLALAVWYWNEVLPHVRDLTLAWDQESLFPLERPVGADFRHGIFNPGALLAAGRDPYDDPALWYPPFSVLFFFPYQLVGAASAYSIHLVLLVVLSLVTILLAVRIGETTVLGEEPCPGGFALTAPIFLAIACLTISSYGFVFSLERGNFDIFPLALSMAGLWLLIRSPKRVWLQVVCFSIAAHLKVYPAILFVILIWKHGRRGLMPLLTVNAALLFCLGPGPVLHFLDTISRAAVSPAAWVGNHSAASFRDRVAMVLNARNLPPIPGMTFYVAPLAVWLVSMVVLVRRGFSEVGAVWCYALSVPLMNLIPSVSHDYKLVLLSAPFSLFLMALLGYYLPSGRRLPLAQILAACVVFFFLSISYEGLPNEIANKYPFILGLQGMMLWSLLTTPRVPTLVRDPLDGNPEGARSQRQQRVGPQ